MDMYSFRNSEMVLTEEGSSIVMILFLASAYGWIVDFLNVIHPHAEMTFSLVMQALGILVMPLGVVLGWLIEFGVIS